MNRLWGGVAAVAALGTTLAGCGGEGGVEQEAHITGWGSGVDQQNIGQDWVLYPDEEYLPGGAEIRIVDEWEEFTGCSEVGNSMWSVVDEGDDWKCSTDIKGWTCSSDEDTHCEADYELRYDYERLEDVVRRSCPARIMLSEFRRSQSDIDDTCPEPARGERRVQASRYMLRIVTSNPDYKPDDEDSNEPRTLTTDIQVSEEAWARANDRETPVEVRVKDGRIDRITSIGGLEDDDEIAA